MSTPNPFSLLDGLLTEWTTPRVRRLIHTLLLIAAIVITIVLAAGGDWVAALGALFLSFYTGSNRANTTPNEDALPPLGDDALADDEAVSGNEPVVDEGPAEDPDAIVTDDSWGDDDVVVPTA
jgi:hypothetical protein